MIHCEKCGTIPVPEAELPVVLPKGVNLNVVEGSPLDHVPEFVNVTCSQCGGPAKRDTDTMDTFVDSNWYYFRYCDPHNDKQPFDPEIIAYWLPVEQYIGGIEHAVMHLIYTRYWNKVMRDMGLVKFDEPVTKLLTQGMVCKESYRCPEHDWLFPEEVTKEKTCKFCGRPVEIGRSEKMSKSKKNAVDPMEMIERNGADALRLFVLFAGPPEKDKEWSDEGFDGAERYLSRVWRVVQKWQGRIIGASEGLEAIEPLAISPGDFKDYQRKLQRKTHQVIRSVTENMEERMHLNTFISSLMELTNEIYAFDLVVDKNGEASPTDIFIARESIEALVRMLVPFAPHIAEEMWEAYGHQQSLAFSEWPNFSDELAREEAIEIAVQVNGKLRGRVFVSPEAGEEEIKTAAFGEEKVQAYTDGKEIVKVVVIPRRLVNIVVK
jgi:leucyl-tRNA synthetase